VFIIKRKLESTLRPRGRPRKRIEIEKGKIYGLVRTGSYIFADLETGKVLVLLLAARDAEPAP